MRAGLLDRRIVIEQLTVTQGAAGGQVEGWATFATVWAEVRPLTGREFFAARQVNAEIDTLFRIRWLADLNERMRINYGGKLYDIHSIAELGRRRGVDLLAAGKVA